MIKFLKLILLPATFIVIVACNQSRREYNAQTEDTSGGFEQSQIERLKNDLAEAGDEIARAAEDQSDNFQRKAENALDNFDRKISNFEDQLASSGESVDNATEQMIDELKHKSNELASRIEGASQSTGDDMEAFQVEMKKELSDFGQNVKNFFSGEEEYEVSDPGV